MADTVMMTLPPAERIVDATGATWTLVAQRATGSTARSGVSVRMLLYYNKTIYRLTSDNKWSMFNNTTKRWRAAVDPRPKPQPIAPPYPPGLPVGTTEVDFYLDDKKVGSAKLNVGSGDS